MVWTREIPLIIDECLPVSEHTSLKAVPITNLDDDLFEYIAEPIVQQPLRDQLANGLNIGMDLESS